MGSPEQIWSRQWPSGWHVEHVGETGSTNADLLAAARAGAPDRSVLAADHQTAGRGRLDRRWEAPAGANLLVSMLFRPMRFRPMLFGRASAVPGELTRRVGLAAVDACREVAGAEAVLKWPNDLLLDGRKLAGILAQRTPGGEVVVGIGLNVGWAPDGAARLGGTVAPADVLAAMLEAYDRLPGDIGDLYRRRLDTLGRQVRVELPSLGDGHAPRSLHGRAMSVDDDGRLVVLDECGVSHHLDVGDVVHVRPVDDSP